MTTKEKLAAMACFQRFLDEAYENGNMPAASEFGLEGEDEETGTTMYDLCNELLCEIDVKDA